MHRAGMAQIRHAPPCAPLKNSPDLVKTQSAKADMKPWTPAPPALSAIRDLTTSGADQHLAELFAQVPLEHFASRIARQLRRKDNAVRNLPLGDLAIKNFKNFSL